jgi:hypothetical protein
LDGDEYDLIPMMALHPPKTVAPGGYSSTPRKLLDRPSNINDVADFVVDFINNDMYVRCTHPVDIVTNRKRVKVGHRGQ